jgi:3-hydroxybutyryl-CoA dehydrogenase
MSAGEIQRAAVIGTGMMGPGIAATFALHQIQTTLVTRSESGCREGVDAARVSLRFLVEYELVTEENALSAEAILTGSCDFHAAIADADFVIESTPEELAWKQDLFRELDEIARPDAILASNTSGLSITSIASKCLRPERVLTCHFWNPPHLMPLVEIVCSDKTSPQVARLTHELLKRCGKLPVLVRKDRPGQLGNRLHQAMIREAVNIVAEGIASVEDVDLAVRNSFGLRLPAYGIFEHQDLVGLALAAQVCDYVSNDLYNEPRAPPLYQTMLESGCGGAAVGRGFYDWTKKDAAEVRSRRDRFIAMALKSGLNL